MARWRSEGADQIVAELEAAAHDVLDAVAELDHLGHRVLTAAQKAGVESQGQRIALHFLRRAIANYAGVRTLFERSAITPVYVVTRAQFELMLNVKALISGGPDVITADYHPDRAAVDRRARYYVAWETRADWYLLQEMLDTDEIRPERRAQVENGISELRDVLTTRFAEEHAAFGPMGFETSARKQYYDPGSWYTAALPSHPRKIVKLAEAVGFGHEHDLFYAPLSRYAHGVGSRADVWYEGRGLAVRHPHDSESFPFLCRWSYKWQADMLSMIATYSSRGLIPEIVRTVTEADPRMRRLGNKPPYAFR